ncbi:MAG: SulP family inorganic anion transporter [Nitrospirae bacterium]|nr:SulP family inorganic anion transporter [Nitrospirota bacterium]MBF0535456.1 SulP family inorganic anion transporter [Nitrospirota bacterium]MBF0617644.1 SulP family inorganic anion transporter [Nitrospirota bacterium]
MVRRVFPFLAWFKDYSSATLRADLIAGITVALVLIPQSMAYAQLAGLPPYYGLYASFLPPLIAALFGSSRQLATGPVAVVSLMSAAALEPLATKGGENFIAYSVLLALAVGIFQLSLSIFRLGLIVNFLSHPVVIGFTNAAAIIIATSQLGNLLGVSVDNAEHHYETIINVVKAAIDYTHWLSLGFAVLSIGIMAGLKKINPRLPGVLIAVIVTTLLSWVVGLENNQKVKIIAFKDARVVEKIKAYNTALNDVEELSKKRTELSEELSKVRHERGEQSVAALEVFQSGERLNLNIEEAKKRSQLIRGQIRQFKLVKISESGNIFFTFADSNTKGALWHISVKNKPIKEDSVTIKGGGAVLGEIPKGLPAFSFPKFNMNIFFTIFPTAMIISILGFMEAISIAKAMATKTGHRLDPNQELLGQGIANILGSFSQSYAVSGSFSRSAVNLQAGAFSGLSSVFTSILVVVTLMFFTPLLYHLPQSVLASIIMMAVFGLINIKGIMHVWHAQKYDGISAILTFIFTLAFAPHLDKGIMIGVAFSLGHYLYRNMKPQVSILSRHDDGTLRNSDLYGLNRCQHISAITFEGSLFFANAAYLEEQVLLQVTEKPDLKQLILCCEGINEIDATGEETIGTLITRLNDRNIEVSFVGLKDQVLEVIKRTGLYNKIGSRRIFTTESKAIQAVHHIAHENSSEKQCPLVNVCYLNTH